VTIKGICYVNYNNINISKRYIRTIIFMKHTITTDKYRITAMILFEEHSYGITGRYLNHVYYFLLKIHIIKKKQAN
jgi:hypothetical protein